MDKRQALTSRSVIGNADIDTQRDLRGVAAFYRKPVQARRLGITPIRHRGNQRCVGLERQIGETAKRLMNPLHRKSPDATFCWEAPRCC
jgi:hypothetical protein